MWSFFSRDPSKEFNYEILEQVSGIEEHMLWKLHKGKKKVTSLIYLVKTLFFISLYDLCAGYL